MFLHIGGDTVLFSRDILAVFDHEAVKRSRTTRDFIHEFRKRNQLIGWTKDTVSYIFVCGDSHEEKMYCSPISCTTLAKRMGFIENIGI